MGSWVSCRRKWRVGRKAVPKLKPRDWGYSGEQYVRPGKSGSIIIREKRLDPFLIENGFELLGRPPEQDELPARLLFLARAPKCVMVFAPLVIRDAIANSPRIKPTHSTRRYRIYNIENRRGLRGVIRGDEMRQHQWYPLSINHLASIVAISFSFGA